MSVLLEFSMSPLDKIDARRGRDGRLESKVRSVERRVGRKLRT
jgi:hypothetical protein